MSNCPYTKPESTAGDSAHARRGEFSCLACSREARYYRTGRSPEKMRRRLKAIGAEVAELARESEMWVQKLKEGN